MKDTLKNLPLKNNFDVICVLRRFLRNEVSYFNQPAQKSRNVEKPYVSNYDISFSNSPKQFVFSGSISLIEPNRISEIRIGNMHTYTYKHTQTHTFTFTYTNIHTDVIEKIVGKRSKHRNIENTISKNPKRNQQLFLGNRLAESQKRIV